MENNDLKTLMVNELISTEDVSSWNEGDYILIEAQTGRGKTSFIFNELKKFAETQGKNILLLSPRKNLKMQNEKYIYDNKIINIVPLNYQQVEYRYRKNIKFGFFDYIVVDECHYIYSDSLFNTSTDLTWKWLKEQKNSIKIFMSATMELFNSSLKDEYINCKSYCLESNYEYVDKFYYYSKDKDVENILNKIPVNEKAIYFASAKKAKETFEKHKDDAAFICSQYNKDYYNYVDKKVLNEIINKNENISCKIICSTSVLDVGINIEDKSIKHIIIDMVDIDEIIQMIGRRRISSYKEINENDKISIYIKLHSSNIFRIFLYDKLNEKKQGDYYKEYGSFEYVKKTFKKEKSRLIDFIVIGEPKNERIECVLNEIIYKKLTKLIFDTERYKSDTNLYLVDICEMLKISIENFLNYDIEYNEQALTDLGEFLESIKNKEILEEQQDEIKNKFSKVTQRNLRGQTMKINTIRKILEENNLPYNIISDRKRINKQPKRYWIITKNDE